MEIPKILIAFIEEETAVVENVQHPIEKSMDRPLHNVMCEDAGGLCHYLGISKAEHCRIELAKAMLHDGSNFSEGKLEDIAYRASYLTKLLLEK